MPNWSSRLFFFGLVAFLIYVIVNGDGSKWYALLTSPSTGVASNGVSSGGGAVAPAASSSPFGAATSSGQLPLLQNLPELATLFEGS